MAWDARFEVAFNPRTIAIVGASPSAAQDTRPGPGATGFLLRLQKRGFPGRLYPINPKGGEVGGLKIYPNLVSVPEPIDLVIVGVPAQAVLQVLEDCIAANALNVHIYSSGFEETGEEEGRRLAQEVKEVIRRGRLRVVGPNCVGLYIPGAKLASWAEGCTEPGPVAFVSQSGRLSQDYADYAQQRRIRFSKVISYGNAYGFSNNDFLEYLATDHATRIIGMYLEGVTDGTRFTRLAREINKTKPLVVWKGGLTEAGARAVASHTGALAGQSEIWEVFYNQTGAIRADSLDELADVTLALLFLPPPRGKRVVHVGIGGGASVACSDVYSREGLEIPPLAPETLRRLREFIPVAGASISNPLDLPPAMRNPALLERALELVATDPAIDMMVISQLDLMFRAAGKEFTRHMASYLPRFARENLQGKPLAVMLRSWTNAPEVTAALARLGEELLDAGIPTYPTQERCTRALAKFARYYLLRESEGKR